MTTMEQRQILRVERRAELAIKNGIDRDTFWRVMLGAYGYTLASVALDRYDSITDFMEEMEI